MSDYVLKFICKETGKEWLGKKVIYREYSIIDPDTNKAEMIIESDLRKRFKSAKGNNCIATKNRYSRPRMYSARTMTKEFRDYLKGENSVKEIAS